MLALIVGRRVQRASFQARVSTLVAYDPLLAGTTECMLGCWAVLWSEYKRLHALLCSSSAGTNSAAVDAASHPRGFFTQPGPQRRFAALPQPIGSRR